MVSETSGGHLPITGFPPNFCGIGAPFISARVETRLVCLSLFSKPSVIVAERLRPVMSSKTSGGHVPTNGFALVFRGLTHRLCHAVLIRRLFCLFGGCGGGEIQIAFLSASAQERQQAGEQNKGKRSCAWNIHGWLLKAESPDRQPQPALERVAAGEGNCFAVSRGAESL